MDFSICVSPLLELNDMHIWPVAHYVNLYAEWSKGEHTEGSLFEVPESPGSNFLLGKKKWNFQVLELGSSVYFAKCQIGA